MAGNKLSTHICYALHKKYLRGIRVCKGDANTFMMGYKKRLSYVAWKWGETYDGKIRVGKGNIDDGIV